MIGRIITRGGIAASNVCLQALSPLSLPFPRYFSPNREPVHGLLEPSREIEKSSSYREFLGVRVIGSSKKIAGSKEKKKTVFTAQGTLSEN